MEAKRRAGGSIAVPAQVQAIAEAIDKVIRPNGYFVGMEPGDITFQDFDHEFRFELADVETGEGVGNHAFLAITAPGEGHGGFSQVRLAWFAPDELAEALTGKA